jgi:prevent-host-death family protein
MIASINPIKAINMIREAPAMTVRNNLGELLNEIQYRGDSVMITKSGKPIAALIDIDLFERLRRLDENFAKLRTNFSAAFSQMENDDIENLIDEAVENTRHA